MDTASDVVSKLEEALEIYPKKHGAIWSLGNAQTFLAFITKDLKDAKPYFMRAMQCFQQALEEGVVGGGCGAELVDCIKVGKAHSVRPKVARSGKHGRSPCEGGEALRESAERHPRTLSSTVARAKLLVF
ncbi:Mitochondrial import receptor subunit TOM20 [Platanthera guangdongensis]|uniref:Mitochondrial import receptor subunit TOM20 n=1 Tax=Platanthera guangdongensis TaxID=2320717 RepID=A0ABR2M2A0_9ASPA